MTPNTASFAPEAVPKRAPNYCKMGEANFASCWARFGTILGAKLAVLGVILAPAEGNSQSGRIIKQPRVLLNDFAHCADAWLHLLPHHA